MAACLSVQAAITSKVNVSVTNGLKGKNKKEKGKRLPYNSRISGLTCNKVDVAVWSVVSVTRQPCSPEGLT